MQYGTRKDDAGWIIRDREGKTVESGFASYAEAAKRIREIASDIANTKIKVAPGNPGAYAAARADIATLAAHARRGLFFAVRA